MENGASSQIDIETAVNKERTELLRRKLEQHKQHREELRQKYNLTK